MPIVIVFPVAALACMLAAMGYALASRAERARTQRRRIAEFVAATRRVNGRHDIAFSGNIVFLDAYRRTHARPQGAERSRPA